jgi:hypothetical protein
MSSLFDTPISIPAFWHFWTVPPAHFWVTGSAVYGLISFVLPLIVGIIGIYSTTPRWVVRTLVGVSVAVVLFGWFLAAKQQEENNLSERANQEMQRDIQSIGVALGLKTDATRDQMVNAAQNLAANIANELKGTKSICYWYANLDAPRESDGGFLRVMVNTGSVISTLVWWVYPAGTDQFSKEYINSPYRNLAGRMTCYAPGFALYSPTIKPGKYGIDFSGSNDSGWHELLTITETEDEIMEEMIIKKDDVGEVLRKSWRKSK